MKRIANILLRALACLLLAGPSFGQTSREIDLDEIRIEHKKFVLDNGLTLLVHPDHSVPIVAVNLWYHVGSRNETRGRTGFAHLFEHFFFNGSENYPHGFREAMDDLGVNNRNGTTNTDRTNFFEDVPVSALERTLYLEADRMGFLAGNLSEEMLERERGVVQNEKRQRENQPYGRVFSRITEAAYPYSHPYSWSTIGKTEDLQAATLDNVKEWYSTFYGPNNCVLSLAGDITYEKALELVEKYFGSIPPGPPIPRFDSWIPRFQHNLRDEMEDRVPQARIYRVYHVPGWGDREVQHLQMAANVLSGSRGNRLNRRLIYDKELATQVATFVLERELASNFLVMATVKPGVDPAEVEREIDTVLAEYLEQGPSAEELQRARSRILSGFIRGTERLGGFGGRSDILAQSMTYGGDPEAYLKQLQVMTEATPHEIRDSARKWLDAHHYTMLVKPFPELEPGADQVDRSILPELTKAPDVRFPEIQRHQLKNGLDVMLLERSGAPIVNLALVVDAGYAADPSRKPGTAGLALQLMEEGTTSRDTFRISDDLEALGAVISTNSSLDQSFVRLRALSMNLSGSLEIFADVILNPAFPEGRVENAKRRRLAQIGQEKAQPMTTAFRIVPRLLFGENHAYSNPLTGSGDEASVTSIGRDDLVNWHRSWFHPNNATLIVTGNISMQRLVPELEKTFGGWKKGKPPEKKIDSVTVAAKRKVYLIDKPGAPQSVLVATHVSKPGGQPEDLAMETVTRLFGGMSTSRLNRNLRLDKHWSYGAFGLLFDARGQRPFMVVAPVQTDKTRESMIELTREIQGIAGQRPITGEEFNSIKRNMTLRLPGRFETLGSLENAAVDLINYGYPANYYADYASNVRQLSESDLNTAAARFIDPESLTWIVIGDLEKVEAGIRELGYGEIVHLGADGRPVTGP